MIRFCEINRAQIFVVVIGNGIKFGSDRSKIKQGNVESSRLMNFILSFSHFLPTTNINIESRNTERTRFYFRVGTA